MYPRGSSLILILQLFLIVLIDTSKTGPQFASQLDLDDSHYGVQDPQEVTTAIVSYHSSPFLDISPPESSKVLSTRAITFGNHTRPWRMVFLDYSVILSPQDAYAKILDMYRESFNAAINAFKSAAPTARAVFIIGSFVLTAFARPQLSLAAIQILLWQLYVITLTIGLPFTGTVVIVCAAVTVIGIVAVGG